MKGIRIILLTIILLSVLIYLLINYNETSGNYRYGNSYRQNKLVNTIRLHGYGITGRGVKVGMLDSGFDTGHPVFGETRILKEYDFAENNSSTRNLDHFGGTDHGTNVFSVIGGYKSGELIGIAYGADFLLAKSDKSRDRLIEEENYAIEGAHWLKDQGADIITTSLSFNKFENADYYSPSQMDGVTARITKTADSLVSEGIVFFSSAGNQYEESWRIIEPPGDGFKVLSIGSVNKYSRHSFFSSCGPTIDGRIKPDLVAPGEGVWVANHITKMQPAFGWSHGTSLAAPIVAGVAALILSCHPELTPEQVAEALKMSASQSDNPDNLCGWGVPDAEKAVSYFGPAFSNLPEITDKGDELVVGTYVFSSYGLDKSSIFLIVMNQSQQVVSHPMIEQSENYFSCNVGIAKEIDDFRFYFSAKDSLGHETAFPSSKWEKFFSLNIIDGKFHFANPHM